MLRRAQAYSDAGEFAGPVDGDEEIEASLFCAHFGDVNVEEADRIGFKALLRRFLAIAIGQEADPMQLQASMQRGAGQARDRGLQGIKAIVERKQGMAPEGDDDRFQLGREDGGVWLPRTGGQVGD
jgi:hypothetical protein